MSSIIFQPLLHDPLGWKQSKSTYTDTYVWKTLRANKNAKLSKYGQQYQKEFKKQQKLQEKNQQETIERILSRNQVASSPTKTPPANLDQPPVLIVEYRPRPPSANRETNSGSRASQHSSTSVQENGRPATSTENQQSPPPPSEEKEKEKLLIVEANDDNTRHWLTFPNPKTPQYLVDIKQRLGQIKTPFVRPSSAASAPNEPLTASKKIDADQRHFLDFNLPRTPDDLRAARHRIAKYRYNPALDNYPPRPQTCPVNNEENQQAAPPAPSESDPPKEDAWTNEEETKTNDPEASTILVQVIDCDGMPNEYVQALNTANAAQEEYLTSLKLNSEKRSNSTTFRSPSAPSGTKTESLNAYRSQRQSTSNNMYNQNASSRSNEFNTWVRNATDKERESALKILRDVLNQPIVGYDIPKKPKKTVPPSLRMNSANRKLGRIRAPHRYIPCEICEKQLLKRHIWSLNQSESTVCPHQAQGIKPPTIEVRA